MSEHDEKRVELEEGMHLELFSEAQAFLFQGVISKKSEDAIWVENATGEDVSPVVYNSKVRLRGIRRGNQIIMLYGTVLGSSSRFWKIGELSKYSFYNKRNHYRHSVAIDTTLSYALVSADEQSGQEPMLRTEKCLVLNVSGGGLLFRCKGRIPVETTVQLEDITFHDAYAPFSLKCRILHREDDSGRFSYGCQFVDIELKEQERLVRAIFQLQSEEIRRRNGR